MADYKDSHILKKQPTIAKSKPANEFRQQLVNLNAITGYSGSKNDEAELLKAVNQTKTAFKALNAEGGTQEMLVAQMISLHQLQQKAVTMANRSQQPAHAQYFTNAAIKLSNAFVQQAALLAKLQGGYEQNVTVKQVAVHQGGQAVVGNVNATVSLKEKI